MWHMSTCECRVCGHQWVGVWPASCDDSSLQCSKCESMSGEPICISIDGNSDYEVKHQSPED